MTLNFPNASRSYDETRNLIRFWGYDSALEICFFIEARAFEADAGDGKVGLGLPRSIRRSAGAHIGSCPQGLFAATTRSLPSVSCRLLIYLRRTGAALLERHHRLQCPDDFFSI